MLLRKAWACFTYVLSELSDQCMLSNFRQGAGEAIRGNFNAALDAATGDRESAARQEEIAHRGATEMDQGYHRGAGAHSGLGGNNTASTNYGPHDTNVGNKLDPRFDSDMGMSQTHHYWH